MHLHPNGHLEQPINCATIPSKNHNCKLCTSTRGCGKWSPVVIDSSWLLKDIAQTAFIPSSQPATVGKAQGKGQPSPERKSLPRGLYIGVGRREQK